MGLLDLFEANTEGSLDALARGDLLSCKGEELTRLAFLGSLERALGQHAVRVEAPLHMDRLGYVVLTLGRALGVEREAGEFLAQGEEQQAIETLVRARGRRVLLLDDVQHLATASPWDLGALLSPRLASLRDALLRGPCVVAYAADAAPRDAAEISQPVRRECDASELWALANGNLERFCLLWAMNRMGSLVEPDAPIPGTDTLARALWGQLRGDARTVIARLAVHGRPLAREHLQKLLPRQSRVIADLEGLGLLEHVGQGVTVLPALRAAALRDAWNERDGWASDVVRLAKETREPTVTLEAHRLLLEAGRAREASVFALYGAELLLEYSRSASLREDWSTAIDGYSTVLELDRRSRLPARTRGYARHYLHYNRYRSQREGLEKTVEGYRLALEDWRENAMFWSRLVRAFLLSGRSAVALDALREAYRAVPPHPQRDLLLLERSYERLLQRQQPIAAIALWAEARALGHGKSSPPEAAVSALRQGIEVTRLWVDRSPPVELGASVRLTLLERDGKFVVVVPGFRGQGSSPLLALQNLIEQARAALPSEARLMLEDVAPQQYEPQFQRLGRTVGPDAAPGVQRELERWWADQGQEGATWLIRRIKGEHHADLLLSVAQCLILSGAAALTPVIDALTNLPREATRYLLLALTELPLEPLSPAQRDALHDALDRFRHDPDPDLVELSEEILPRLPQAFLPRPSRS